MASLKQWLVSLTGIAFLAASTAGTHLHYCFDGGEPPVSVHVTDGGVHHVDQSQDHNDIDVDLTDQATGKAFKVDLPWLAIPAVWIAPVVSHVEFLPRVVRQAQVTLSPTRFLSPPLRGPPV